MRGRFVGSILPGVAALALGTALAAIPARAADGPCETQMTKIWQDYQKASNGFHDPDSAGTFKKGAVNFILFAQKADAIVAGAAKGDYKSVAELQEDAGTLLNWMTLQRNVIAANVVDAMRIDAGRVRTAPESERAKLESLEAVQEQADSDLLHGLQLVMAQSNQGFAQAERALAQKLGE
ncbi:MAG TPA: hypothetical protein VMF53_11325 [Alphaproteobacteria bacterium]|nr:hypothetical protein [Alphaproteobacteria bacterium]